MSYKLSAMESGPRLGGAAARRSKKAASRPQAAHFFPARLRFFRPASRFSAFELALKTSS